MSDSNSDGLGPYLFVGAFLGTVIAIPIVGFLLAGSPDFVDSMICRNMSLGVEDCGRFIGLEDKTETTISESKTTTTKPRYGAR